MKCFLFLVVRHFPLIGNQALTSACGSHFKPKFVIFSIFMSMIVIFRQNKVTFHRRKKFGRTDYFSQQQESCRIGSLPFYSFRTSITFRTEFSFQHDYVPFHSFIFSAQMWNNRGGWGGGGGDFPEY